MINWSKIAEFATRILISSGKLPKPTDVYGHNYDKIIYSYSRFWYCETRTGPLYSSYMKVITKQDIMGIVWFGLTIEERIQLAAEILGSND